MTFNKFKNLWYLFPAVNNYLDYFSKSGFSGLYTNVFFFKCRLAYILKKIQNPLFFVEYLKLPNFVAKNLPSYLYFKKMACCYIFYRIFIFSRFIPSSFYETLPTGFISNDFYKFGVPPVSIKVKTLYLKYYFLNRKLSNLLNFKYHSAVEGHGRLNFYSKQFETMHFRYLLFNYENLITRLYSKQSNYPIFFKYLNVNFLNTYFSLRVSVLNTFYNSFIKDIYRVYKFDLESPKQFQLWLTTPNHRLGFFLRREVPQRIGSVSKLLIKNRVFGMDALRHSAIFKFIDFADLRYLYTDFTPIIFSMKKADTVLFLDKEPRGCFKFRVRGFSKKTIFI